MTQEERSSPGVETPVWARGDAYEAYVGRWSRLVAPQFVAWLSVPVDAEWLDVGCGTGALSQTILRLAQPSRTHGVDQSQGFLDLARQQVADARATFAPGDAQALPVADAAYDAVVSGLMLNFVAQPALAVAEMARAARPGGVVAAYIWDYAGQMQFMRHFWNAAALDPAAIPLDEGRRCAICQPEPLAALWSAAGLSAVETRGIVIDTHFASFDDFWSPFLAGQGPAPTYTVSLSEAQRLALRERLRAALPFAIDGSIPLVARAWAVRGTR